MKETVHKTVLLKETVEGLNLKDGSVAVDGTLGGGGHTKLACQIHPGVKIYAFDLDGEAIQRSKEVLAGCNVEFIQSNFRDLKAKLEERGVLSVDGIMLDLGFSSDQLEQSERGFTFQKDEPLIMTLSDKDEDINAEIVVNEWAEETLADIILVLERKNIHGELQKQLLKLEKKRELKQHLNFEILLQTRFLSLQRKEKQIQPQKHFRLFGSL
jgi:16S rRNA (cytosine1402-N4)-methyltransferase